MTKELSKDFQRGFSDGRAIALASIDFTIEDLKSMPDKVAPLDVARIIRDAVAKIQTPCYTR